MNIRAILSLCAVDLCPGELYDTHLFVLLHCFIGRESNASRLWIGKRTPGYNTIIDLFLSYAGN